MADLSILIPARNEEFLGLTVEDILKNIEGDTEIIIVLDGYTTEVPKLPDDPRITIIKHHESVGQRAATNEACRLSKAKYVMKVDAHCAFDKGFDVKLLDAMVGHDDWTMVPRMYNLHVFDWECQTCKHRDYQGPKWPKCPKCGGTDIQKLIIWQPRWHRLTCSYMFSYPELKFGYWGEWKDRPEADPEIDDTMCLLGACWLLNRERYWELNISDEAHGSWGQQGVEVACKTWLSGGRLVVNKKTWFSHLFRTQPGFGFPYPQDGKQVDHARAFSRDLWLNDKWPKAVRPLSWLIEKFKPPTWENYQPNKIEDKKPVTKGVIYYTDNKLDPKIMKACQEQLKKAAGDIPIVSASLQPIDFGKNIHLPLERGYLTMFKQILAALEASTADIIFFCEHDLFYHPSHFEFTPTDKDIYYYNTNVWKVRLSDGHAMRTADMRQLSGLCAYRERLIEHYRERVRRVETEGFSRKMGFEPGTHNRTERVDDFKSQKWESPAPNVDIRHNTNLTQSRWSKDEFRDQRYTEGWQEADEIPEWGKLSDFYKED